MTGTQNAVSPIDAVQHYANAHRGEQVPLPDAVDAIANLADTDSDVAKSALFWLINKGQATLTPAFMVAFPS